MPRTNGIYTLPAVYLATPGTEIRAEQHNVPLQDIAQALTNSLPRDGSAPMLGPLAMGGNRMTGLAAATSPGDAVRLDQVTPFSSFLSSASSLAMGANEMLYASAPNVAEKTALTPFARTLLDDATADAARTTLGLSQGAVSAPADQAEWNAGTSTTERIISPAKLLARVRNFFNMTGNAPAYAVRAWVNFTVVSGAVTINAQGNVASVTREATGIFRITFSTPMPDVNYVVSGSGKWDNTTANSIGAFVSLARGPSRITANYVDVIVMDYTAATTDNIQFVGVQVVR